MGRKEEMVRRTRRALREAGRWMSAQELAAHLGVTERSVRNYVRQINAEAEARGEDPLPVRSSSQGYRWDSSAHEKAPVQDRVQGEPTPESRLLYIARELTYWEGASFWDLPETLRVSDSTVERDLRALRTLLASFDLHLRRSGDQLSVEGEEASVRHLMLHLILSSNASGAPRREWLELVMARWPLSELREAVRAALDAEGLEVLGYELNVLLLQLYVMVERRSLGKGLATKADGMRIPKSSREHRAAARILAWANERFDLEESELEVEAAALMVFARTERSASTQRSSLPGVADAVHETVERTLLELSRAFGVDLADPALAHELTLHLRLLLIRAPRGEGRDDALARIQQEHPFVCDLAFRILARMSAERGLTWGEEDVVSVAKRLWASIGSRQLARGRVGRLLICPEPREVRELLRETVERRFGDRLQVERVVHDLSDGVGAAEGRFVLSTVEIADIPNLHLVTPFFSRKERALVQRSLERFEAARRRSALDERLGRYLRPEAFELVEDPQGRDVLLNRIAGRLRELGYADEALAAHLRAREAMGSTSFIEGVALPHGDGHAVQRSAIFAAVCPEGLLWGEGRVRVVLCIALAREDMGDFHDLYVGLAHILQDRSRVEALAAARSFEELRDALRCR